MRYALGLEYDGRAFCGFQSQASRCGVQDALERALREIAGEPIAVVASGRTDAGVHATSQIVHFDTASRRPDAAWTRGVNAHLPVGAAVLWARRTSEDFHARFAALARHYAYLLLVRAERPALEAGRVGWYHRALDLNAMSEAVDLLVGTHDFSAFRAAECQAKSPVRTLATARVSTARVSDQSSILRFEFTANAFLHHMIRNIVGALVYVGAGRQSPHWIAELLEGRDRTRAAPTFAPDGLYFEGADYESRFALPATRRAVSFLTR